MGYATQQDMVDRFGREELMQLTDRIGQAPIEIDDAIVTARLADADETIDGYLQAAGLTLPLASVPALLTRWACDIARYFLHAQAATEQVRQNYDDAIKGLRDVVAGRIRLQVDGAEPERAGADVQVSTPTDRVFDRDTLADF